MVSHNVQCADGTWTSAPRIEWLDETTDTASDMLADQMFGNAGVDECAKWMRDLVMQNGGEMYSSEVRNEAGRKYSDSMLTRARKKAGVRTRRTHETHARSVWFIPVDGI